MHKRPFHIATGVGYVLLRSSMFVGDMEMLDAEFDKWHNKQLKREDALKQVEDKVKSQLIVQCPPCLCIAEK